MVYVFLAEGFEEIEAIAPVDIMRRAGIEVKTVGVGGMAVRGSHGVTVTADISESDVRLDATLEAAVLPGGTLGTKNLKSSASTNAAIKYAYNNGKYVAAICAAPTILASAGLLGGRKATVYPSMANELGDSYRKGKVVVDDKLITGEAAGSATDFALELVRVLRGEEISEKCRAAIHYCERN